MGDAYAGNSNPVPSLAPDTSSNSPGGPTRPSTPFHPSQPVLPFPSPSWGKMVQYYWDFDVPVSLVFMVEKV